MAIENSNGSSNEARYNIRVLDRALTVLELLSDGRSRTALEVSKGIELNQSTTFRLLSTLTYFNYIRKDDLDKYTLGIACLELARAYQASNDLRKISILEMEKLRDGLKDTVHLAVLSRMEVVYIEKLPGLHPLSLLGSQVGGRSPAFCTGIGKALLAYQNVEQIRAYYSRHELRQFTPNTITDINKLLEDLSQIRNNGYSVDDQEHEAEVCCIAAPIFNLDKKVVAAISVSGPRTRMDPVRENTEVIQKVKETVLNISRILGYRS